MKHLYSQYILFCRIPTSVKLSVYPYYRCWSSFFHFRLYLVDSNIILKIWFSSASLMTYLGIFQLHNLKGEWLCFQDFIFVFFSFSPILFSEHLPERVDVICFNCTTKSPNSLDLLVCSLISSHSSVEISMLELVPHSCVVVFCWSDFEL